MTDFEILKQRYSQVTHPPSPDCKRCQGEGELFTAAATYTVDQREYFKPCWCTYLDHNDLDINGKKYFHHRSRHPWHPYMYVVWLVGYLLYHPYVRFEVNEALYKPTLFRNLFRPIFKATHDFIVWAKLGRAIGIAPFMSLKYHRLIFKHVDRAGYLRYQTRSEGDDERFTILVSVKGLTWAHKSGDVYYPEEVTV